MLCCIQIRLFSNVCSLNERQSHARLRSESVLTCTRVSTEAGEHGVPAQLSTEYLSERRVPRVSTEYLGGWARNSTSYRPAAQSLAPGRICSTDQDVKSTFFEVDNCDESTTPVVAPYISWVRVQGKEGMIYIIYQHAPQ